MKIIASGGDLRAKLLLIRANDSSTSDPPRVIPFALGFNVAASWYFVDGLAEALVWGTLGGLKVRASLLEIATGAGRLLSGPTERTRLA